MHTQEGISQSTDNLKIAPFRSYLQHTGWEKLVDEYHSKASIFLGLDHTANLLGYMMGSRMGSDNGIKQSQMAGESICLATSDTFPGRMMGNGRLVKPLIDFSFPDRPWKTAGSTTAHSARSKNRPRSDASWWSHPQQDGHPLS